MDSDKPTFWKRPLANYALMGRIAACSVLFGTLGILLAQNNDEAVLEELKKRSGFKKYLNKGQIAAVFKPEFIAAKEAELPDDAWVIGVSSQGKAKAYSINLLNKHEIVNDFIGDKPIATTW